MKKYSTRKKEGERGLGRGHTGMETHLFSDLILSLSYAWFILD